MASFIQSNNPCTQTTWNGTESVNNGLDWSIVVLSHRKTYSIDTITVQSSHYLESVVQLYCNQLKIWASVSRVKGYFGFHKRGKVFTDCMHGLCRLQKKTLWSQLVWKSHGFGKPAVFIIQGVLETESHEWGLPGLHFLSRQHCYLIAQEKNLLVHSWAFILNLCTLKVTLNSINNSLP